MNHVGNVVTVPGPINICGFCEMRQNPAQVTPIINQYKAVGVSNKRFLDEALTQSDYVTVLSHVWAERNKEKRLTWLREKAADLHAPLMYELAIAEFVNAPTVHTVINVTLPLMNAAKYRVMQDAQCSKQGSVMHGDAPARMSMAYLRAINDKTMDLFKKNILDIMEENKATEEAASKAKTKEVLQASINKLLPNPKWLESTGMDKFFAAFGGAAPEAPHTPSECTEIRNAFANRELANLN